jgi:hypothetical protein
MNIEVKKAVFSSLGIGTLISILGVLGLCLFSFWMQKLDIQDGLFSTQFASKWGGRCAGWNHSLVYWYVSGQLMHWWAYATIPVVLLRLHPTPKEVPTSGLTVVAMAAFFWGCGFTHLVEAVGAFVPMYNFSALFLNANGVLSVVGSFLIAWSLCHAFAVVKKKREEIDKKREEIDRMVGQ